MIRYSQKQIASSDILKNDYFFILIISYFRTEKVVPAETVISFLIPAQLLSKFSLTKAPSAIDTFFDLGSTHSLRMISTNSSLHIMSNVTSRRGGKPPTSLAFFISTKRKGRRIGSAFVAEFGNTIVAIMKHNNTLDITKNDTP